MIAEVLFTRAGSVAQVIERLAQDTSTSIYAALYRLNHPRLARLLENTFQRGVEVRLILDRLKYGQTPATRELLAHSRIPFRLLPGRQGLGSKMHHKFAILDGRIVLTGSYNWTLESEEQNFEDLVILRDPQAVANYSCQFGALWAEAVGGDELSNPEF
jgi:phosphatidylserine/phosphatidylglycerophosphate/cardiolipin synthase-like enzyme